MSDPALTFQIALGNNPGDSSFTWTTIPGCQGVTYTRGQPNEYDRMETGTSSVVLGDATSALDPNNTGSAYYPNVKRMRPTRAFITVDGTDYPLFQHFIERLPRSLSVGRAWTQRNLTGTDAFAWFALAGLKGKSYAAETTGSRWGSVLDDVNWPATRRSLDAGNSSLPALVFADDDSTKALDHLLEVGLEENGFGFLDALGAARFIERHAAITDTTIQATFADGRSLATGDYTGALPYVDLQPESTEIVNDYSAKSASGSVLTASDADSIDEFGPRSQELTYLISSDDEVRDSIQWRLAQTKDGYERIDGITVMPATNLTYWATVLDLEVGDRILVVEWPPGFDAPVETQFLIRHIEGDVPVPITASSFTFQLTPTSQAPWLILDDATAGKLDSNKLGY